MKLGRSPLSTQVDTSDLPLDKGDLPQNVCIPFREYIHSKSCDMNCLMNSYEDNTPRSPDLVPVPIASLTGRSASTQILARAAAFSICGFAGKSPQEEGKRIR